MNAEKIELNADEISATKLKVGDLQAENAEFTKMLSGTSAIGSAVITRLSVSSFTMGRKAQTHKKVIAADGSEWMALGYKP